MWITITLYNILQAEAIYILATFISKFLVKKLSAFIVDNNSRRIRRES